jgi:predicted signal transduction protein with EAL and GGDEF domain
VAAEKAMVARIGADEFAILIENPTTGTASTIRRIHETLAEPDQQGVVTSACIGVVDNPRGMTATEILDAAELALARAKRIGPGQSSLFHPAQDIRDREAFRRSVSPRQPVKLTHRPLVRLHDRAVVGLDAMLNVPGMPARLLRLAAEQAWQYPALGIHIGLTGPMPEVLTILGETRLPADRLWLGMPASAMTNDTVGPLADAGVRIEIRDFGADDIGQLAELPVHAVRIPHRRNPNFLVTEAMKSLTALVHMTETEVIVDGVDTEQQAEWWQRVGADTATGDFHNGR